jgi:hypothetical protein
VLKHEAGPALSAGALNNSGPILSRRIAALRRTGWVSPASHRLTVSAVTQCSPRFVLDATLLANDKHGPFSSA